MESLSLSPSSAWLVDFSLQSTLVLAIALAANHVFRRRSAAKRHLMMSVAVAALPLLLVYSWIAPDWQLFEPVGELADLGAGRPIELKVEHELVGGAPVAELGSAPVGLVKQIPAADKITEPRRLPLVGIWIIGLGALCLRLVAGVISLGRLAGKEGAPPVEQLLASESASMGVSPRPRLLHLGPDAMPMTWGVRHHVIGLPDGAREWSPGKIRRVLRHELAHVARRDCATAWAASLCLALLWFHPLAWLLKSGLVKTREAACDDLALDGAPRPERNAYVRELVEIIGAHQRSRRHLGMAIALAMGGGKKRSIERRLVAILDEGRDRGRASRGLLCLSAPIWIVITAGIGMLAAVPKAAGQKELPDPAVAVSERKTYALVKAQIDALMPQEAQQDPFARDPFGGDVPVKPMPIDLESAAASARFSLISRFGVAIGAGDPVEIEFESRFKMVVTAPAHVHQAIAWVLDSLLGATQVHLTLHVYEIEDDEWLEQQMGGAINPSQGKLIGRDEFEELKKGLGKRSNSAKTMPSVVSRSGQRCKVESIKEFIYPTEYDPPELPASSNGDPANKVPGGFAVTPANPTAFDVRNVGVTWAVEPVVRADGSIEINTTVEDVQFEGFINYGSEINGIINEEGKEKSVILTDNRILQPVFSVSKVNTSFVMPPGKVVALRTFAPRLDRQVQEALQSETAVEPGQDPVAEDQRKLDSRTSHLYLIEAKLLERDR